MNGSTLPRIYLSNWVRLGENADLFVKLKPGHIELIYYILVCFSFDELLFIAVECIHNFRQGNGGSLLLVTLYLYSVCLVKLTFVLTKTDPSMPEGVDPSFLAALPESIRQEVIAEQLRLQRIQQRAQEQQQQAQQLGVAEVDHEFLAALPPTIQEEVNVSCGCF